MKSLVIVAHGSKREHSNNEVLELMNSLKHKIEDEYPIIESSFLEFATPSIPEAIELCVQQGATDIKVLPYFLSAGKHVYEDIPQEAEKAAINNKHICVEVLPHLGSSQMMVELLHKALISHEATSSVLSS